MYLYGSQTVKHNTLPGRGEYSDPVPSVQKESLVSGHITETTIIHHMLPKNDKWLVTT
jgi:hypothetical protein